MAAGKKKRRRSSTVLPGERDEEGRLLTPHTKYGLARNILYIFRKLWQYGRIAIVLIVLGACSQSVMKYLWSYIGKFVIDIVQMQAGMPEKDMAPLLSFLFVMIAIELVCIGTNTIVNNRIMMSFTRVRTRIMTERIDKVLSMDYQTLEQSYMLDLFQRASNSVNNGVQGMMNCIFNIGVQLVTMVVSVTAILRLDWRLILVLTVAMLINYLSFLASVRADKREYWDKMPVTWRKKNYMQRCTQDFDYAKDIRLFDMKDWLLEKQKEVNAEHERKFQKGRNYWLRHSFIYTASTLVSSSVMYYILIVQVLEKGLSIGDFTLFLGLCAAFANALADFYVATGEIQGASMQTDDFRTFMDYPSEETGAFYDLSSLLAGNGDALREQDGLPAPDAETLKKFQKGIFDFTFRNVSFRYEGQQNYALKNLNLFFPAGQRLAVVGVNGAGKTTFIKLLLRLYDVTEGEILLNGINIRHFRRKEYYRLFAPVFQNVELFAFPLAENVSMRNPEETNKTLAESCLCAAGLQEKLGRLEGGVDTEVLKIIHDDGVDFSGGERQKLALARALYKNSPVIVLDEPTAALDALAEYELYQSFDRMVSEKSAVYISHRLSSTRFCDAIAMFVAGEMIEYGTHEELLEKGGAYAGMFEVQAQYYEEKIGGEA